MFHVDPWFLDDFVYCLLLDPFLGVGFGQSFVYVDFIFTYNTSNGVALVECILKIEKTYKDARTPLPESATRNTPSSNVLFIYHKIRNIL